jgi:hypothetical protein
MKHLKVAEEIEFSNLIRKAVSTFEVYSRTIKREALDV